MKNEYPQQKRRPASPEDVRKWLDFLQQLSGRPTPEPIKPQVKVRKGRKHAQT